MVIREHFQIDIRGWSFRVIDKQSGRWIALLLLLLLLPLPVIAKGSFWD